MAKCRLLVTGCRGQLGSDLVRFFRDRYDVCRVDIEDFDICDRARTMAHLKRLQPEVVLHTAAYTDVDGAESDPRTAFAVNAEGSENVGRACAEIGARMVYYSTDYVFDGAKTFPYEESDAPNPQTQYGRSKLAGERAVTAVFKDKGYVILRVAWLYGRVGKNFVRTMVNLGHSQLQQSEQGQIVMPIPVVDDQVGNPCWTVEVARQTEVVLEKALTGLYHATSDGETSWFGLARVIFEKLQMPVRIVACSSGQFGRTAPRPRYSSLDNAGLKKAGLSVMRPWQESLEEFLVQTGEHLQRDL